MIITHVSKNMVNDYSQNKRLQAKVWVTYTCTQADADAEQITVKIEDLKVVASLFVQGVSPNDPARPNAVNSRWVIMNFNNTNVITLQSPSLVEGFHPNQVIKIFATGY